MLPLTKKWYSRFRFPLPPFVATPVNRAQKRVEQRITIRSVLKGTDFQFGVSHASIRQGTLGGLVYKNMSFVRSQFM